MQTAKQIAKPHHMRKRMKRLTTALMALALIFAAAAAALGADTGENIPDLADIRVLDLATAKKIALANNPTIEAAAHRAEQAAQRVRQAGSAYLPRLDANAQAARVALSADAYTQALQQARFFDPATTVEDPAEHYKAGITATWRMFDGFSREFNHAASKYARTAAQQSAADTRRLILSAVAQAYNGAMLARENVAIAQADVDFFARQVEEAKIRREIGTGSLSDVLSFQVGANEAKSNVISAKQSYEVAMYGLAALLGAEDAAFAQRVELAHLNAESMKDLAAPDAQLFLQKAKASRPDILRAEAAQYAAEAQVKSARGEYYPTIDLSAGYAGERTGDARFEQDDFGTTLAATVNINLFAGGLIRAKVAEAKAAQNEARSILRNTQTQAASEVLEAIAKVKAAQAELLLQRENADLVRQNRDLVEMEYKAGQASLVTLKQAQRDLVAAQGGLASARVNLRQAWQDLHTSTGEDFF